MFNAIFRSVLMKVFYYKFVYLFSIELWNYEPMGVKIIAFFGDFNEH